MELMAVGRGREVAPLPLPAPTSRSARRREGAADHDRAMTGAVAFLGGALLVDEWSDPVAAELAGLADEARAVTAAAARFDARLASAYVWGAAELAARSGDQDERRRREWGARGMLAELAATLHLPEGTLARRLTRITMLSAFPGLHRAHTVGVVSAAHVSAMLDVFAGVTDTEVLAAADAALADRACRLTAPQLRAAARRWRSRHVPVTAEQRAQAVADRFVDVTPADADLCWLTALLPAAAATAVMHRVDDLAAAVAGPDEARTLPQLRADVLCDLLLATEADTGGADAGPLPDVRTRRHDERSDATTHRQGELHGQCAGDGSPGADDERSEQGVPHEPPGGVPSWVGRIVPQVVLTVPVLTLLGHSDEPVQLDGFGPIDLDTARALCANAPTFTRVLTHPETGTVLSVGRQQYAIPADLRRAVALRDGTCRFPGCRRRAARCDVDHSTAWADGGTTDLTNLACLCRKHHRLKHEAGWKVTHEPDGVLHWHSPVGRHYRTRPATALWPPPPPDTALWPPPTDVELRTHTDATHPQAGCPDAPPF